ncbi:B12-binding domain-containing radical SAM protein [Candidatus Woesearchaeota archaeon]|nr:B12-binding domain-containing radical SAM protein [Candidatus Woesearchaeota archaeon]
MMRILLVSPYNDKLRAGQYLSPPLGIYRIASYIRSKFSTNDVSIDVLDPNIEGIDELYRRAEETRYDIVGFSLLYTTYEFDLKIISRIRELSPASLLIAGGQGAVFTIRYLLKNTPLQVICKGFGEFALEQMIPRIIKARGDKSRMNLSTLDGIKGLAYEVEGKMTFTGFREPYTSEDFSKISLSIDFKQIPFEKYWSHMESFYSDEHLEMMCNDNMLRTIRLVTSSHCPRKCAFCSSTNFLDSPGRPHPPLMLSPEDILTLTRNAVSAHPSVTAIYYCDDDFLQDKERILELTHRIKADSKLKNLNYFCLGRIDNVRPDILKEMRSAGFKFIIYGIESFSNRLLKEMNKGVAGPDPSGKTIELLRETISSGLTPLMNLILFYPTSNKSDVVDTIEKATLMVAAGARVTVYPLVEYYPGSRIAYDNSFSRSYKSVMISDLKSAFIPEYVLPADSEISSLAKDAMELRKEVLQEIILKHNWKGVAPHPIYSLALFVATYRLMKINYNHITSLIDELMRPSYSLQQSKEDNMKTLVSS